MKSSLRRITIIIPVLLMAALLLQPGYARVSAQGSEPVRTVTVSGSGQVSGQPDVAVITLGVQTEAEEARVALSQNSQQMQALIDVLKKADIAAEDIQTQAVRLQPRYEEQQPGKVAHELVGYVATNTVEVQVRDLDTLGELLDAAVQAGGNRIEGIRFEISESSQLLDQAREAAWNDAEHKAEQLVNLAGAELGEVLTINESSRRPRPIVQESPAARAASVPIEPGTQAIEVDLEVTWFLR